MLPARKAAPQPQGDLERRDSEGPLARYTIEDILKRDKANLDVFWLRDESLEDSENLPPPEVLAQEIADDLEAALGEIQAVLQDLPNGDAAGDAIEHEVRAR